MPSSTVMTVLGPVPVEQLGVTLMHEHIMVNGPVWFEEPDESARHLVDAPVHRSLYEQLRVNSSASKDNCFMLDEAIAIDELNILRPGRGQRGRRLVPRDWPLPRQTAPGQRRQRREHHHGHWLLL